MSVNTTLQTVDGVAIDAGLMPARSTAPVDHALVVAHGFTGHRRQDRVIKIVEFLRSYGAVISFDFRGHGASGGRCTVGMAEVQDVGAAVQWARSLDFSRVTTVGFSMGGAVVLRQAALDEGSPRAVHRVVSVSAPAFWYYRGTAVMRLVHNLIMNDSGRFALRLRGIRMDSKPWPDPPPMPPVQAIRAMRTTPALIVHGDRDRYFPMEHAHALHRAGDPARVSLMSVPGFGHAEAAIDDAILTRIGDWAVRDR